MEKEKEKEKEKAQPICAEEALNLLNCVTDSPFDQDKCLTLLNSLRNCVLHKKVKKFSLAEQSGGEADATLKKHN